MGFIKDFKFEIKDDSKRYIQFTNTYAVDYIEYIRIEMRKTPEIGFKEIYPSELYGKMFLTHLDNVMIHNFLLLLSYTCHYNDPKFHPDEKIYYRCYRYWHHSHDGLGTHDKDALMLIEDAMKYIKENKFSIEIVQQDYER